MPRKSKDGLTRSEKIVNKYYADKDAKYQALAKEYFTLAHKADRRMKELENLQQVAGYEKVLQYAYRVAQANLHGGTRFEKTLKSTNGKTIPIQSLQKRIRDIKTFLDSPTSTKSGITKEYQKRADTLNEKYNTNITWEDIAKASQTGILDKLDSLYASSAKFIILDTYLHTEPEQLKAIKKSKEVMQIVEDEEVNKKIHKALRNNRIKWSALKK